MMTERRNALVEGKLDPAAPPAPDIGVAIGFGPQATGSPVFHVGKPVVLLGAYKGDGALLQACKYQLSSAIYLVVARLDQPKLDTVRLLTPMLPVESPDEASPPNFSRGYRESGGFKVDLQRFLELPDEPGKYIIEATLGTYKSARLQFEIVR